MPNTRVDGSPFDEQTIEAVWKKAQPVFGFQFMRTDVCGTQIHRYNYGKQEQFGWEIDHIRPVAEGGNDNIDNLQPLYWETNRKKGDTYPWHCP